MPEGGSSIFTDAHGYQACIQDILDLVVLQPREFYARLTWADLSNLQLLRAKEVSVRIGFMRLPSDRVFVTFPAQSDSALFYGSRWLRFGDLMLHSRGERLHQRTTAACEWASISIAPATLSAFGRSLSERHLVAPAAAQVVRPRRVDGRRLERLHARVCRTVERNLDSLYNREVVRAVEQDLISVLISCLAHGEVQQDRSRSDHRIKVLAAFEDILALEPHKLLRSREICAALGISESTLKAACMGTLGMSPGRYQRLRRLKRIRAELLRAKSSPKERIEDTIIRYGFSQLHRFVTEYWSFYGEMPPIRPLDRADA